MLAPLRTNANRQAVVKSATVPAPVKGWDAATALAAMDKLAAIQLTNWFPQPGWVEVRRGYQQHARNLGTSSTPVQSLMAWNGPAAAKMFAAAGGVIYDVTASGAGTSAVTSLSENRWQSANMTTSAGAFLFIVNGTDAPRHYNGTTWATPTITGTGYTATDSINVNVHKKRIWLVQKDSTKAFYLGTEAIAGTATAFELGSNFNLGGYLVAMATWTLDAGSGPDDYAVFISSKGQLAVYQGTDPASADTWALVGVFDLAPPIGRRCFIKFGTAPAIITMSGVLHLALNLKEEKANLTASALTGKILNAMNRAARSYSDNFGWQLCVYPKGTRLYLNVPTSENATAVQYVMNTITGAWCDQNNHNANCWLEFEGDLYFAANNGKVYRADTGSADIDTPILAVGQTAYQAFFTAGNIKRYSMVQPLVTTEGSSRPSVGISADFQETSALSTLSGATQETSLWGEAVWGEDLWGGAEIFVADWTSTPAMGRFGSVKFQANTGTEADVSTWGSARWAQDGWGSTGIGEQTMQINGFVVLAEVGGHL